MGYCERCGNDTMRTMNDTSMCTKCGFLLKAPDVEKTNIDKWFKMFLFAAIAILLLVLVSQVDGQMDYRPFRDCASRAGGQVINVIWSGSYVESMRNTNMINRMLDLPAIPVEWDSTNGAHIPSNMEVIRNTTIALTMSDGTLVSLIINMAGGGQYAGWMTYSTYRTTASYNSDPNPHVLCGFWLIDGNDYENLRTSFLEALTQAKPFEDWMR